MPLLWPQRQWRTPPYLPNELMLQIAQSLTTLRALNALVRASRNLHSLLTPLLYWRAIQTWQRYSRSIISTAAARGDLVLLQGLLAALDRTVEITTDEQDIFTGTTALMSAIILRRSAAVQILLSQGASADATDFSGWTALHWAPLSGDCEVSKSLLTDGASVDSVTKYQWAGHSPLHFAAVMKQGDMVRFLMRNGADVEERDWVGVSGVEYAMALGWKDGLRVMRVSKGHAVFRMRRERWRVALYHAYLIRTRWDYCKFIESWYAKPRGERKWAYFYAPWRVIFLSARRFPMLGMLVSFLYC